MSPFSQPATLPITAPHGTSESLLGRVADEFLRRLEAGERPSVEEYTRRHPEIADTLRRMLGALVLLEHSADASITGSLQSPPLTGVLGDFRVLHEIGRGGMGVVYEAEQISLGRRVALKILPFASVLDPRQLTRFQNEARATATLNHPHIVPVYTTGVERGVHYLAMRLIDGESLARYGVRVSPEQARSAVEQARAAECSSAPAPACLPAPSTLRDLAITTHAGGDEKQWYRRVAQWGVEAAEALEHAHSLGIVHRDIKPGNLLIDGDGKLWVTDFGLARLPTDAGLTMTGDVLGTLRYMSPEQALARHGLVDHRTDIYSLGATLYELLTHEPVVQGKDRETILRNLAEREARPLRTCTPRLPVDLETVVLKAVAHETAERYYSARELADDLRRVINGDPVRARRPSVGKRVRHWLRRNARVAATAAAIVLLLLSLVVAYGVQRYTQVVTTAVLVGEANNESLRYQQTLDWQEALAASKRASALADAGPVSWQTREYAELRRLDIETALALDNVRIDLATSWEQPGFRNRADESYTRLFTQLGIAKIDEMPIEDALSALRKRTIPSQLAVSLDSWATQLKWLSGNEDRISTRLELAAKIDPDPLRNRLRAAMQESKEEAARQLISIANDPLSQQMPPVSLCLLAESLHEARQYAECIKVLRHSQSRHPDDFWLNYHLGTMMLSERIGSTEEAVGFLRVALSKRPHSAILQGSLRKALAAAGKADDSERALQRSLALEANFLVYRELGLDLFFAAKFKEARDAFSKAVTLNPTDVLSHVFLGNAFIALNDLSAALAEFDRAIVLDPRFSHAYARKGLVFEHRRQFSDAVAAFRQAIELGERKFDSLYNAAFTATLAASESYRPEQERRQLRDEAHLWLRQALLSIDEEPGAKGPLQHWHRIQQFTHWQADDDLRIVREHDCLAKLDSNEQSQWRAFWGEIAQLRAASELALEQQGIPLGIDEQAKWRFNLGYQLQRGDRLAEAEAEFKKVLELQANHHRARMRLASIALRKSGQVDWSVIDDPLRLEARIEVLYFAAAGAVSAQAFRSAESPEAIAMRTQALAWLREALQTIQENQTHSHLTKEGVFTQWRRAPDLAYVREPSALRRLPDEERRQWEEFWRTTTEAKSRNREVSSSVQ